MSDSVRFRFGPLERRGVLLGLRVPQLVVLSLTALGCGLIIRSLTPAAAVIGVVLVTSGGLVAAFLPIKGRTLDELMPVLVRWGVRKVTTGHRLRAPLWGFSTDSGVVEITLPGGNSALSLLSRSVPGTERAIGVLRDEQAVTYTGVLSVRGRAFSLLDDHDKVRRLGSWAAVLTGFAREGSPVSRIQWVERTLPDPGDAVATYLKDNLAVPLDSPIARSYLEVVDGAGPVSQEHEVFIALQIDARKARRAIRSLGSGDEGACELLRRELTALSLSLISADVGVEGALTPRLLAGCLRSAFDPASRASLAKIRARDEQRQGTSGANAGPLTAEASWTRLRTDGAWHATYWIAEWPRVDVDPDFLAPLLLRTDAMRSVAVTMEPVSSLKAIRSVEAARTSAAADEELRNRAGFVTTNRRHMEHESLAEYERDLGDGHSLYRFAGFITVSASSSVELDEACADIEEAAARCLLDVRRLNGQQDSAFSYTLPLCRGPR